jgi:hypothetical protein
MMEIVEISTIITIVLILMSYLFFSEQKVTYKDLVRKQILEELGDDDDQPQADELGGGNKKRKRGEEDPELAALRKKNPSELTPAEEQRLAREEFLSAAFGGKDGEEEEDPATLLKKRARTNEEEAQFENEYRTFLDRQAERKHVSEVNQIGNKITGEMLKDFWLSQDGLDDNERFLREYVSQSAPNAWKCSLIFILSVSLVLSSTNVGLTAQPRSRSARSSLATLILTKTRRI